MTELFGFHYQNNNDDSDNSKEGSLCNLFGALVSRRIYSSSKLYQSGNFNLSIPSIGSHTQSFQLNSDNSISRHNDQDNITDNKHIIVPHPENISKPVSVTLSVHRYHNGNRSRKFLSECSNCEFTNVLKEKLFEINNNHQQPVKTVEYSRNGFVKYSLNALLGLSSEVYNLTPNLQHPLIGNQPLLMSGYSHSSSFRFYQEIKIHFLVKVFIEKHALLYFSDNWLSTSATCNNSNNKYKTSNATDLSGVGHALMTLLDFYQTSMSSLIVAIRYNESYDLSSILTFTNNLRQYLIFIFQIFASDSLNQLLHQYLNHKTASNFDFFHSEISTILNNPQTTVSASSSLYSLNNLNLSHKSIWDILSTLSSLTDLSYASCHHYHYNFYTEDRLLQYSDMSIERGKYIISCYCLKSISTPLLSRLQQSLFLLQSSSTQYALGANNTIDTSSFNNINYVNKLQTCLSWITNYLKLYMNPHTSLNMYNVYGNIFTNNSVLQSSSSSSNENKSSFTLSPYLRELCYDASIILTLPFTQQDISMLFKQTHRVKEKFNYLKQLTHDFFSQADNVNNSSGSNNNSTNKISSVEGTKLNISSVYTKNQVIADPSHSSTAEQQRNTNSSQINHSVHPPSQIPAIAESKNVIPNPTSFNTLSIEPTPTHNHNSKIATKERNNNNNNNINSNNTSNKVKSLIITPTGYEKFVNADKFEIAKSKILTKYFVMMSAVDKRKQQLQWQRKRAENVPPNREKLIQQRIDDIAEWEKELSNLPSINKSNDKDVNDSSSKTSENNSNDSVVLFKKQHHSGKTISTVEASVIVSNVMNADSNNGDVPAFDSQNAKLIDKPMSQYPEESSGDITSVVETSSNNDDITNANDTDEDIIDGKNTNNDNSKSIDPELPLVPILNENIETITSLLHEAVKGILTDKVDVSGITNSIDNNDKNSNSNSSSIGTEKKNEQAPSQLTLVAEPNEIINQRYKINNTVSNINNNTSKADDGNKIPVLMNSFQYASQLILDRNLPNNELKQEEIIAKSMSSFSQSLLILAKQESLCDVESLSSSSLLVSSIHNPERSSQSSKKNNHSNNNSHSIGENNSTTDIHDINSTMNQPISSTTESTLIPLIHWQCKLFDQALLLSIYESTNGNLLGHINFIYDTFLFSEKSTFMKTFVSNIMNITSSQLPEYTLSSMPSFLSKSKNETTTPWTTEKLNIAFLQTTKILYHNSNNSNMKCNKKQKQIVSTQDLLKLVKFSIKDDSSKNSNSMPSNNETTNIIATTSTEITHNTSDNNKNDNNNGELPLNVLSNGPYQHILSTLNLDLIMIHYKTSSPMNIFLPEKTTINIISQASRRIMEVLQISFVVSILWQKFRENRIYSNRKKAVIKYNNKVPNEESTRKSLISSKAIKKNITDSQNNKTNNISGSDSKIDSASPLADDKESVTIINMKRTIERLQNYSLLLVQQTIQLLLNYIWDQVNTSQRKLLHDMQHFESQCNGYNNIGDIASIIHNNFIELLFSFFILPIQENDCMNILTNANKHRSMMISEISYTVTLILELCRNILQCIGNNQFISMSQKESFQQSNTTDTNSSTSLYNSDSSSLIGYRNLLSSLSESLNRKLSQLVVELKDFKGNESSQNDAMILLISLGRDL